MPFQRIVVALDLSFRSDVAFQRALEEVNPRTSQLMLVHAQRLDAAGFSSDRQSLRNRNEAMEIYSMLQRMHSTRMVQETHKAEEEIHVYCKAAVARGIATQVVIKPADPGVLICEIAQRWNADLIVLARKDHAAIKSHALGSVGTYVINHAPCSLLLVQGIPVNLPPTPAANKMAPQADDLANCLTARH